MTSFPLHLLRHGAPQEGALPTGALVGWTDVAPSPEGIALCMTRAEGIAADRLVSSDLDRARAVGERLSARSAQPLTIDPRWREMHFGAWDGIDPADIPAEPLARFRDDPDACPPPGGESWTDLRARVDTALRALEPAPTLVVTHGGAMRAALSLLCGLDLHQCWAIDLPYAARLSLRVWPGERMMAQITGLAT